MKSILIKQIKDEFDISKIGAKKLELYNFYELCGYLKRLRNGEDIK